VRQVYYGWYVVAITIVIFTVLVGSIFSAFGVFVLPVSAELKLSRAEMNTAIGLVSFGNAALAPFVGWLLDRVAAKSVMVVCSIVYGVSMVTLGLAHILWLSTLVLVLGIPLAYLGAGSLSATLLIARWFTARRGRAMMLTGLGLSLGSLIGPPAIGLLVEANGWRTSLIILGVGLGALLVGLAVIVRERPGPNDVELTREPVPGMHPSEEGRRAPLPMKVLAILQMPQFWTMSVSTAVAMGVFTTIAISLIPLARAHGLSMLEATGLMSVMGAAAIVGALLFAPIADRVDRVSLLSVLFLLGVLLNAVLLSGDRYVILLAAAITLGVATGTATPTFYALLADRFRTSSFGTVRGISFLLIGAFAVIELRFGGALFDRTGDYRATFGAAIALSVAAAALMLTTRFTRRDAGG
jgi:MFS family permease